MQVADVRCERDDGLAVDLDNKAQHAMGRGMLRTHVDDHGLIGRRSVPAIEPSIGDDVFNAGVNRCDAGQFFNCGCH